MQLQRIEKGFIEVVKNERIERLECMHDGSCTVFYRNNLNLPERLDVGCTAYNRQYGIPVSEDGSKLFVGCWEKGSAQKGRGLVAYDIESGSSIWKLNEGRIRMIFVYKEYLIVTKANAAIYKIDINNGEVLATVKGAGIEYTHDLETPYILVDSLSGKLSVLNVESMCVVKRYSQKIINPSACLSITINDATLSENRLTITGFEMQSYSPPNLNNPVKYTRVIDDQFI